MSSPFRHAIPERSSKIAKRILVVDADRQVWETRARLLIARGYVVHRISGIAEAPPRWPAHLYDLVVLAAEDPANPEVMEFCRRLEQTNPPVRVALLARSGISASGVPVIRADLPPVEIAEGIVQLLSNG